MTADSVKHTSAREENLLVDLQALLERQLKLAHKGDIAGVESLGRQANSVIETIVQRGNLQQDDFQNQREKLQKLYGQLLVAVSAQKAETGKQLSWIRKGRKTIGTYRKNI
jgi:hypothetical protein